MALAIETFVGSALLILDFLVSDQKMVVPSDTSKKCLINCGAVLQYVKQAGVPLLDEDGTTIMAEDVVNGDKELILSLLWNMFVHLQVFCFVFVLMFS